MARGPPGLEREWRRQSATYTHRARQNHNRGRLSPWILPSFPTAFKTLTVTKDHSLHKLQAHLLLELNVDELLLLLLRMLRLDPVNATSPPPAHFRVLVEKGAVQFALSLQLRLVLNQGAETPMRA